MAWPTFTFKIEPALWREFRVAAAAARLGYSAALRQAIREWLLKQQRQEAA